MMTKTSQPGAEPANVFEDRDTAGQWRGGGVGGHGRRGIVGFSGSEALLRELVYGALGRLTVPHGIKRQRGRVSGSGIWARHIGWRLRMGRVNEQSERGEKDIRLHCRQAPYAVQ